MTNSDPKAGLHQPDLIGDEDAATAAGAAGADTDAPDTSTASGTPVQDQARPDASSDSDGADLASGRS